jgi:hypothetical protein
MRGRYAKISEKITISGSLADKFMEICAIVSLERQFGYKRGNLSGLNSGRDVSKTFFGLWQLRLPHNLSIYYPKEVD